MGTTLRTAPEQTREMLDWIAREVNRWTADADVQARFEAWVRRAVELQVRWFDDLHRWERECKSNARRVVSAGLLRDPNFNPDTDWSDYTFNCIVPKAVGTAVLKDDHPIAETLPPALARRLARQLTKVFDDPRLDMHVLSGASDEESNARWRYRRERLDAGTHVTLQGFRIWVKQPERPERPITETGTGLRNMPRGDRLAIAGTRVLFNHDARIEDPRMPVGLDEFHMVVMEHTLERFSPAILESDFNLIEAELRREGLIESRNGPRVGNREPELILDTKAMTARIRGHVYPLTPDQLNFVAALVEARGGWVTGKQYGKVARVDHLVGRMPEALANLIERKKGAGGGYRLSPSVLT